jgi:WD40 repeat protein
MIAVAASFVLVLTGGLIFMRVRGARPRTLDIQMGFISSIVFSPDAQMLAISGSDGRAELWDTSHVRWLRTFQSYQNSDWVAFSPDGHTLATWGASSGSLVVLWDVPTGSQIRLLSDKAASLGAAAFSPDGRLLATGAYSPLRDDRGIRLWDADSGNELRRFPGYLGPVFSPNGKLLAAWNKSGSISLLDVGSGNEVRTFGGHRGYLSPDVIFSPDGRLLAGTNDNAMVTVWDVASGNEVRTIYDSALVRGIAFSPDSRLLASGSEDYTIKLWDVGSGHKVRMLSGHSKSVNCVAFSPDGRLLASGGADGKVILWPLSHLR